MSYYDGAREDEEETQPDSIIYPPTYVPRRKSDFDYSMMRSPPKVDTVSRRNVQQIGMYMLEKMPHYQMPKETYGNRIVTMQRTDWGPRVTVCTNITPAADRTMNINPLSQCEKHNCLIRTQILGEKRRALLFK